MKASSYLNERSISKEITITTLITYFLLLIAFISFHSNSTYFFCITSKYINLFDDIQYKWPAILLICAFCSNWLLLTCIHDSICCIAPIASHGKLLQNVKLMFFLSSICFSLFFTSFWTRSCIGFNENYLRAGCRIGNELVLAIFYKCCFYSNLLSHLCMLVLNVLYYAGHNVSILKPVHYTCALFSITSSSIMMYLDIIIQPWLLVIYTVIIILQVCFILLGKPKYSSKYGRRSTK